MHIILGASGNVGSTVVDQLLLKDLPVKGITRHASKMAAIRKKGATAAVADVKDLPALQKAFAGGSTLFAITPETGKEENVLEEARHMLQNYRHAVESAGIWKVVGLSSIGAQFSEGTGNLLMSHMLEHAFDGLNVRKVFIRPTYYFSNWLPYLDTVKQSGVLPSFLPAELSIPMMSPQDVAGIAADILADEQEDGNVYELEGPEYYTPADVAQAFSKALHMEVKVQEIPRDQWQETLQAAGFSADGIKNFVEMTDAVVNGKTRPEGKGTEQRKGETSLETYIQHHIM